MTSTTTHSLGEQRALWTLRVAGTAILVLGAILTAIMPARPVGTNVPGFQNTVVGFELSSEPAHVFGILGRPGTPERVEAVRRMDLGNRIDFLFMVAYPALYVGIALLLAAHGRVTPVVVVLLIGAASCMTIGDALENRELFALSAATEAQAMTGALMRLRVFTLLKWYAIYGASGLAAVYIWREAGWWRWSAVCFGVAALCGLTSTIYLPAIELGTVPLLIAWTMTYVRSLR